MKEAVVEARRVKALHENFKWELIDKESRQVIHGVTGWTDSEKSREQAGDALALAAKREGYVIVEEFGMTIPAETRELAMLGRQITAKTESD